MLLHDAIYVENIPTLSDTLYRYTLRLLKHYRSYHWQLKVFTCKASVLAESSPYLQHEQEQLGKQISFLSDYLSVIDHFADLIRSHHPHGEQYYWILYYTYLSPTKPECTDNILDLLAGHGFPIPRRTYFRKRKEAVETLAILISQQKGSWGMAGQ